MRRFLGMALWLIACCICLAPAVAFWQSRDSGYNVSVGGGGFTPSCSQSSTFLAAATGVTLTADKTNYDTLICGLVSDTYSGGGSIFAQLDVLYIWAAPTETNASLINLVNPGTFNGTKTGTCAPCFSAYVGYTGNASDFFIDSGFNPFSAGSPHYVLNSATVGVYVQTNLTSGAAAGLNYVGANNTGTARLVPFFFGSASYTINFGTNSSVATTTTQGQWIVSRSASNLTSLYRNGSGTALGTSTDVADFVPRVNFAFFAEGTNFSSPQMSAGFIGSGFTSADEVKIAARINTFMTAYSINVY